ncbi:hypothetical protein GB928_018345 [Shinella curvata]|uniref:Uncharacterized protein n=1 Tax=Shinella curvata TaxID=1817964 RepID=A0ABT8XHJ6_9HYPH|nr:hypothetical protein [Shinella curvata]MCJ8053820.1 hypothetical protein [Shinella curvata]MDO6123152.1 hypothetical protein [Shinella curvata]
MKMRVTFEVDQNELFDMLKKMNGDFAPLGGRVVGELLTSGTTILDAIGMAVYGVTVVSKHPVTDTVGGAP